MDAALGLKENMWRCVLRLREYELDSNMSKIETGLSNWYDKQKWGTTECGYIENSVSKTFDFIRPKKIMPSDWIQ